MGEVSESPRQTCSDAVEVSTDQRQSGLVGPSRTRLIVGYGAIACAIPYLVLKIIWLAGGQPGVADAAMMRETNMIALNVLTAGMDLVAIAIALTFTHAWGQRVPAWLVLPPMWVATGLLAKFVAGVPVAVIAHALSRGEAVRRPAASPVHLWVYGVVYTEFVGMGIGLMLAFVLYARTRWSSALRSTTQAMPSGATHAVQVPLAVLGALFAAVVGGLQFAWAFGASIGLGPELVAQRTLASYLIDAIDGAIALAAAAGVLMMVYRTGRRTPFWVPLTMAWVGGGSLFGWGLWRLINVLGNTALLRGSSNIALLNLVSLERLLGGLVIGLVTVFLLAERAAAQARAEAVVRS